MTSSSDREAPFASPIPYAGSWLSDARLANDEQNLLLERPWSSQYPFAADSRARFTRFEQQTSGEEWPSFNDYGPDSSSRTRSSKTIVSWNTDHDSAYWSTLGSTIGPSFTRTNSRNYSCDQPGCNKSFDRPSNLKKHQKCHTPYEERPHVCATCSRHWLSNKDLKRHMQIHAPAAFACNRCSKSFKRPDHLKRHLSTCRPREDQRKRPASQDTPLSPARAELTGASRKSAAHLVEIFTRQVISVVNSGKTGLPSEDLIATLDSMSNHLELFSMLVEFKAMTCEQEDVLLLLRHWPEQIESHVQEQKQWALRRRVFSEESTETAEHVMRNADPASTHSDAARQMISSLTVGVYEDLVDISNTPGGPGARKLLLESDEHEWLAENIKRDLTHTHSEQIKKIREEFMQNLRGTRQNSSSPNLDLDLTLDWSPGHMINDDLHTDTVRPGLGPVIAITGGANDAYATTCEEYVREVWPTVGAELLRCIEHAATTQHKKAEAKIGDSLVTVACRRKVTIIRVKGSTLTLLQVFEVAVWLATTCRESRSVSEILFTEADIVRRDSKPLNYGVSCIFSRLAPEEIGDGLATCWHGMLRNPVIAKGFPIPRRYNAERGLELSLPMLAILGQSFWATFFDGFLLKGFNSMLSTVRRIKDSVLWHFSVNKDGSRICYGDSRHARSALTSNEVLFAGVRHFVGWAEAEIIAGTPLANYDDIGLSDSNEVKPGVGIDTELKFSGGHFINVGFTIRRNDKDAPEYLRCNDYETQMSSATKWGVVLVDTTDRHRHYLVDGATAILHLSRASLSPEHVLGAPCEKAAMIQHPETPAGPVASCMTLKDIRNRKLRLSLAATRTETKWIEGSSVTMAPETTELWFCFENLAQQMFHTLEQIHDRFAIGNPSTFDIQLKKRVLTGFEFLDLVSPEGPVKPRYITLQEEASDWHQFSLQTNTINLFGSNFGDLIRPKVKAPRPVALCSSLRSKGTGHDHLVVPLSVLQRTTSRRMKHTNTALQLAENMFLLNPHVHFRECQCGHAPSFRCWSLVTHVVKSPGQCNEFKATHTVFKDFRDGAFVFGHKARKLIKHSLCKRKAEQDESSERRSKRNASDSGVDVGSSQGSSSPSPARAAGDITSSSGFKIRGAASIFNFTK